MKLLALEIDGFRRFAESCELKLDSKTVAIVGPNEAGKTSVLRALEKLNDESGFLTSGPSKELTRKRTFRTTDIILRARFLIENAEKSAISKVDDFTKARFLVIEKFVSGELLPTVLPELERDFGRQRRAAIDLKNCLKLLESEDLTDFKLNHFTESNVRHLIEVVEEENQVIDSNALDISKNIRNEIVSQKLSEYLLSSEFDDLASSLNAMVDFDEISPSDLAGSILYDEFFPNILFFGEEERDLQSTYQIPTSWPDPPKPLENIAALAQLDLNILARLVDQNDRGRIVTLLDEANKTLNRELELSWSQSEIDVRFDVSGDVLTVLVKGKGGSYEIIAERSDGLRQYLTLRAFIASRDSDVPPIVLIDEAETHLHYDAQADLVQMFARQKIAAKVIYSTHSLGCLPEDLGSGVRLVKPDGNESTISNWFWDDEDPGYSPIIFGIGAQTLAFFPVRLAVIVESASDIVLLPRLFRESISSEQIGFQIVPGIAEASLDAIKVLDKHGHRTVYLTDADKGGKALKKKLTKAGIDKTRIFELPDSKRREVVLEDFADQQVYLDALNEEFKRSHGDGVHVIAKSDLSTINRPKSVKAWCNARKIDPPSKCAVAYRIIENDSQTIINSRRARSLAALHNKLTKSLGL